MIRHADIINSIIGVAQRQWESCRRGAIPRLEMKDEKWVLSDVGSPLTYDYPAPPSLSSQYGGSGRRQMWRDTLEAAMMELLCTGRLENDTAGTVLALREYAAPDAEPTQGDPVCLATEWVRQFAQPKPRAFVGASSGIADRKVADTALISRAWCAGTWLQTTYRFFPFPWRELTDEETDAVYAASRIVATAMAVAHGRGVEKEDRDKRFSASELWVILAGQLSDEPITAFARRLAWQAWWDSREV